MENNHIRSDWSEFFSINKLIEEKSTSVTTSKLDDYISKHPKCFKDKNVLTAENNKFMYQLARYMLSKNNDKVYTLINNNAYKFLSIKNFTASQITKLVLMNKIQYSKENLKIIINKIRSEDVNAYIDNSYILQENYNRVTIINDLGIDKSIKYIEHSNLNNDQKLSFIYQLYKKIKKNEDSFEVIREIIKKTFNSNIRVKVIKNETIYQKLLLELSKKGVIRIENDKDP